MQSAFGIQHGLLSKRLPSSLRGAKLVPLGAAHAKQAAHLQGREASRQWAMMRSKKPGWTTHRYEASRAVNAGRQSSREAKAKMGRLEDLQIKRKVLI
jgi:hypothetical protein